jgi:predicted GIY-YIG superfamily endonuclease
MYQRKRMAMPTLKKADIPISAGVYALYREDKPMYVGKANCLRDRVWKNHSGRGRGMGTSAMRRNVAEHLGVAKAAAIKAGEHRITPEEATHVRAWLDACEITWRECADEDAAKTLETNMKAEYLPPLTKR